MIIPSSSRTRTTGDRGAEVSGEVKIVPALVEYGITADLTNASVAYTEANKDYEDAKYRLKEAKTALRTALRTAETELYDAMLTLNDKAAALHATANDWAKENKIK
jgi:hypothetical protein